MAVELCYSIINCRSESDGLVDARFVFSCFRQLILRIVVIWQS